MKNPIRSMGKSRPNGPGMAPRTKVLFRRESTMSLSARREARPAGMDARGCGGLGDLRSGWNSGVISSRRTLGHDEVVSVDCAHQHHWEPAHVDRHLGGLLV